MVAILRYGIAVLAATVLAAMVAGCAIKPPVTRADARCALRLEPTRIKLPAESYRKMVPFAGSGPTLVPARPVANAALLLSGGSQHGAFGAGYLAEWARMRGGLPRFAVVTGVSTGAILSTWAFLDQPGVMERAYAITREAEVLTPHVRRNAADKISPPSYLSLARHNARGTLEPLRRELVRLLDDPTMEAVARESTQRLLQIAIVDADSGEAMLANMGELARRFAAARGAEREVLRNCYAAAIVASSSVPMAAPPTFIDNRMYIDGGTRFGIVLPNALAAGRALARDPATLDVYLLVNGSPDMKPRCGRARAEDCVGDADPVDTIDRPHKDWDLLDLGQRSVDIITNQVYRFSIARVARDYPKLHYTTIDRDRMLDHVYPTDGGRTCRQWREEDVRRDRPIEFYPRYMNCVIDYGRTKARDMQWDTPGEKRSDPIPED